MAITPHILQICSYPMIIAENFPKTIWLPQVVEWSVVKWRICHIYTVLWHQWSWALHVRYVNHLYHELIQFSKLIYYWVIKRNFTNIMIYCAQFIFPLKKISKQKSYRTPIGNRGMHDTLSLDSLPSSHPISVNIENPVFQENFDTISYGKVEFT